MHSPGKISRIEQQVMASVGVIYTARRFVSAAAIKLYILVAGVAALAQLTWVHRVFENWANVGLAGTLNFLTYALTHTHPMVQITLIVLVVAGMSLARDLVRPVRVARHAF